MIAEIYGKISSSGSNLNERLEDNLTGNVFGALRYLPFNLALGPILRSSIFPKSIDDIFESIHINYWDDKIKFWPFDNLGELDVLIEFDDLIIGIEVKYQSDLSSDDGKTISDDAEESQTEANELYSVHQLFRESKIIFQRGQNKRKILLFIAKNAVCSRVYENTIRRGLIEDGVEFGYLSWETFLDQLSNLKLVDPFYNLIISDLIRLLKKKKLEYFRNMLLDDGYAISDDDYFKFDNTMQNLFKFTYSFDFNVKGDLYYEFR